MILIPFSSGLDSTTLVYKALEKKEKIEVCYIAIKNNVEKTNIEQQQRKKLLSLFRERYSVYIGENAGTELSIGGNEIVSMPQIPVWIMGLLYSTRSNIKEIRIGYCMNDDAVSHIEDIQKIWKSYQAICRGKLPKLTFPLLKRRKTEHQEDLPNDIFQETFFCEDPKAVKKTKKKGLITWEDCGNCGTCKRAKYDGTFELYSRNSKIKFSSSSKKLEPMSTDDYSMEEKFGELSKSIG